MAKVFVPHVPSRYDSATRLWIPTINLDPAAKHGEVVEILPPSANRAGIAPVLEVLKTALRSYSSDDYIVAVGDPSLFAAAACIAAKQTGGLLRMLKWDRLAGD